MKNKEEQRKNIWIFSSGSLCSNKISSFKLLNLSWSSHFDSIYAISCICNTRIHIHVHTSLNSSSFLKLIYVSPVIRTSLGIMMEVCALKRSQGPDLMRLLLQEVARQDWYKEPVWTQQRIRTVTETWRNRPQLTQRRTAAASATVQTRPSSWERKDRGMTQMRMVICPLWRTRSPQVRMQIHNI